MWEIITIFRHVESVEGRIIPRRNNSLRCKNGLVSHGSCWFWTGKGFHEGKKREEFSYLILLSFSRLLVHTCNEYGSIDIWEWTHTCKHMLKRDMQNAHRNLSSLCSKTNSTEEAKLTMIISFIPVFKLFLL